MASTSSRPTPDPITAALDSIVKEGDAAYRRVARRTASLAKLTQQIAESKPLPAFGRLPHPYIFPEEVSSERAAQANAAIAAKFLEAQRYAAQSVNDVLRENLAAAQLSLDRFGDANFVWDRLKTAIPHLSNYNEDARRELVDRFALMWSSHVAAAKAAATTGVGGAAARPMDTTPATLTIEARVDDLSRKLDAFMKMSSRPNAKAQAPPHGPGIAGGKSGGQDTRGRQRGRDHHQVTPPPPPPPRSRSASRKPSPHAKNRDRGHGRSSAGGSAYASAAPQPQAPPTPPRRGEKRQSLSPQGRRQHPRQHK